MHVTVFAAVSHGLGRRHHGRLGRCSTRFGAADLYRRRGPWAGFLLVLVLAFGCGPALAVDGVIGPGNCNGAGFASVVGTVDASGGGTVTFNCGSATITVSAHQEIANHVVIDGGGTITLDGGSSTSLFQVYNSGELVLEGLTLQHATFAGGHNVLENFGYLKLEHVRVINNSSSESTVLNNFGTLIVRWSTFSGNSVSTPSLATASNGGAIAHMGGVLDVRNSIFKNNDADGNGGAIYSEGEMHVLNSTFYSNVTSLGGGAVFQGGSGNSTLDYLTVVNNSGLYGAGIYNEGSASSTLTISRSILTGNTTGNCDGVIASGGYNLEDGSHCGGAFTGPGDLTNQGLPMGSLGNHGGPTETAVPANGSPAIDHIPAAQCGTANIDQRGAARRTGSGCDSGALERGGTVDLIFMDGFE